MNIYRIVDWDKNFESSRSREIDSCSFVCVPNKQHGGGFLHIMRLPDGPAIYGIWHLILQACSMHSKKRSGWLTNDGKKSGKPWNAEFLAFRFKRKPEEFKRALEILSSQDVGWIEIYISDSLPSNCRPSADVLPSSCRQNRREVKGREQNKKQPAVLVEIPENLRTDDFLKIWAAWHAHRKEKRRKLTPSTEKLQLQKCVEWGPARAAKAVLHSIEKGWIGIFEADTASTGPPRAPVLKSSSLEELQASGMKSAQEMLDSGEIPT